MLDKARVYERLQRRPFPTGWEPTFKDQHHISFLQDCVGLSPIPPVSELWLHNMVQLLPAPLTRKYGTEVAALVEEVRQGFTDRLRRDLVARTVPDLKPVVEPPVPRAKDTELPWVGFSPWYQAFFEAWQRVNRRLMVTHHCLRDALQLCRSVLSDALFVDWTQFQFPRQFSVDSWKETLTQECETEEVRLDRTWYRQLVDIFGAVTSAGGGKLHRQRLFASANTLAANELRNVLMRTVEAYVSLFRFPSMLPLLEVDLILDGCTVSFYPPFTEIEEAALFPINQLAASLQRTPLIEAFILGDDAHMSYMTVDIPDVFLEAARHTVSQHVRHLFEAPLHQSQQLESAFSVHER
ncbi:dynein heavy chain 12, axonemal-like [Pollicipes pollicipes]|uniref:dynein heavy chain 12, axonemal-like n=1 Tax=Pollicipes pollicipes TaxID=41117 RepID=UPI001884EB51|nr:dynein heavy chain 12, axonemal-like [Pollicipes pollicipes]